MTALAERARRKRELRPSDPNNSAMIGQGRSTPYLFSLPTIIVVAAVLAFPVLYGVWESLFRPEILGAPEEWVGLQNYAEMFQDEMFWSSLIRTFIFVGGCLIIGTTLGLLFAFALFQVIGKARFLRSISLAPYLISNVAAALMFRILFNSQFGLVNGLLGQIGIDGPSWLSQPVTAMLVVIFAQVWTDLPLTILLLLGGLMTIDRSYLDAALVDGATGWTRARYVTMPLLTPQIVISTVWLSYSTLTGLGVVLALTGGGPLNATTTLAMDMYLTAFRSLEFNRALAIATFILVLNALLTLTYVRVSRRYEVAV